MITMNPTQTTISGCTGHQGRISSLFCNLVNASHDDSIVIIVSSKVLVEDKAAKEIQQIVIIYFLIKTYNLTLRG